MRNGSFHGYYRICFYENVSHIKKNLENQIIFISDLEKSLSFGSKEQRFPT
jgi:hypothetical protein